MIRSELAAAALTFALGALAAWACGGSPWRRALGLCLGLGALGPAWLSSCSLVRAVLCLLGALMAMRVVDLVRRQQGWGAARRLLHVFSLVDSRLLRRVPRAFDGRSLAMLGVWLTVVGAGLAAAYLSSPAQWFGWPLRWWGGLWGVYGAVEALWALMGFAYPLAGFSHPSCHRFPAASLTVRELWGERWSRPIGRWLDQYAFRPLARRGLPRTGLVLAFLGSGVLHGYAILAAAGVRMAGLMVGYFLVQAMLVALEHGLRVTSWPRARSRAWTLIVMLLTSPLFTEPALRATGIL